MRRLARIALVLALLPTLVRSQGATDTSSTPLTLRGGGGVSIGSDLGDCTNEVLYGNASQALTCDPAFTYNDSTDKLGFVTRDGVTWSATEGGAFDFGINRLDSVGLWIHDTNDSGAGGIGAAPLNHLYRHLVNTGAATTTQTRTAVSYTNLGDADGSSITLRNDPETTGIRHRIIVVVAQTITIAPSTGETLYYEGDQCLVSLTSATIGTMVDIEAAIAGSGGMWVAEGSGWTCNDA